MPVSDNFCARIAPLLSEYIDGEASAADTALIKAHLTQCVACASEVGFLRATNFVVVNGLPDVRPPADLFSRVAQATYARRTWRERLMRALSPAPVRVGLGAALAAGVFLAVVVPLTTEHHVVSVAAVAQSAPRDDARRNAIIAPPTHDLRVASVTPRKTRATTKLPISAAVALASLDRSAPLSRPADGKAGRPSATTRVAPPHPMFQVAAVRGLPSVRGHSSKVESLGAPRLSRSIHLPERSGIELADRTLHTPRTTAGGGEVKYPGAPLQAPNVVTAESRVANPLAATTNMPEPNGAVSPGAASDVLPSLPSPRHALRISLGSGTTRGTNSWSIPISHNLTNSGGTNGLVSVVSTPTGN